MESVKAAVVQAAPILFDKNLTIEKACHLIAEAGTNDSKLVLLPEAYIPAYPRGFSLLYSIYSKELNNKGE